MNTIIKYSAKLALLKKFDIAKAVYDIINKDIEFKEYHIIYNGVLESGVELSFFEKISKENLLRIHILLKNTFKDYKCFYISNEYFEGCIKEYLFNDGCKVMGTYKQGFKQENIIDDKPIINQEVKKVISKNKKNRGGRPKGSKNKPKNISNWSIKMNKLLANIK